MKQIFFTLFLMLAASVLLSQISDFNWAKQMGGTDYEVGRSIAVDNIGNVYTTGDFRSTTDFDPGIDTYNLTSASQKPIAICN